MAQTPKRLYITLDVETVNFYKDCQAIAETMARKEREKGLVTFLRRVTYSAAPGVEWEAHCVDWTLPERAELVVGSAEGPMDCIHGLKKALFQMGYQDLRLHLTNIERIHIVLDD